MGIERASNPLSELLEPLSQVAISVVIPTLGGDCLRETLQHLNASSVTPAEILICIPKEYACRVADYEDQNVRVLETSCRGQVAQRAAGFKAASNELVLQLDDDIIVDPKCLETLSRHVGEIRPRAAVAPALRWRTSRKSVYKRPPRRALARFFYWCVNGSRGYCAGVVTRAGTEIGIHSGGIEDGRVEVEWLPGGCVMHRRVDLVLDDFFPLSGKAYCEDLIHSHLLARHSVRLFVSHDACAFLAEVKQPYESAAVFMNDFMAEWRARRYYVGLSSRSMFRMYLYFAAKLLRRMFKYEI